MAGWRAGQGDDHEGERRRPKNVLDEREEARHTRTHEHIVRYGIREWRKNT